MRKNSIEKIKAELTARYETNPEWYLEETEDEVIVWGYDEDFGANTRLESVLKKALKR